MDTPVWKRSRLLRFTLYVAVLAPLAWFSLFEGLILILLLVFVVEFACFPGTKSQRK